MTKNTKLLLLAGAGLFLLSQRKPAGTTSLIQGYTSQAGAGGMGATSDGSHVTNTAEQLNPHIL